jgi:formylglycine-generating enzyme required for sulfatase activity
LKTVLCCVLCLSAWAAAFRACAQTAPGLGLQFLAGRPTLSITGVVGSVCTVQYITTLSPTNNWQFLTNLTLPQSPWLVVDPSGVSDSRFYRVFSQSVPLNAVTTNMVWIAPGTFVMGSPTNEALRYPDETQHNVTISRGVWMGQYLVTQGDYLAVVGGNPSYFQGDPTRPVEQVSWNDATNYCALRTQQEQTGGLIPTNYLYRLPTESEWEYACRAGTTTAFNLGTALRSGQANFDGQYEYDAATGTIYNPNGIYLQTTTPVGSYAANRWGLYDMVGNVWEWCQDWYGGYPAGSVIDPQGAATGSSRVLRGGTWHYDAQFCRSAQRNSYPPTSTSILYGFRVVLALSQ